MAKSLLKKFRSVLSVSPRVLYKEEKNLLKDSFYFSGTNGKGVLLIQGWSSTPYELRRLGVYLNESGYTVYAPLLKGHGTVSKDLKGVYWEDWMDDVKKGYEKLEKECKEVHVGGTSIGASMAISFAAKEKGIASLILMATPYKFNFEKTARFLYIFLKYFYVRKIQIPLIGSSRTITRLVAYRTFPVRSVAEVFKAVRHSIENLDKITQPCFLLQSRLDQIISRDSMEKIFDKVNSKNKHKKYIEKNYHTFISDIESEHVFEDILSFINSNENRNIH